MLGVTDSVPFTLTVPTPLSMEAEATLVVLQVKVEVSPSSIDVGLAVIEQVGTGKAFTVTSASQVIVEPLFPTKVPV